MTDTLELFKQPRALNSTTDRDLRFAASQPYLFAKQQMMVPVLAGEAALVAREYVFAFGAAEGSLPLALLGRARGYNAYVESGGHWLGRYVPAHIRRYPFVLAERTAGGEGGAAIQKIVVADAAAPHLASADGVRLFDEVGAPTAVLQQIQSVLVALEEDGARTLRLVDQLNQAGVIVSGALEIAAAQPGGERVAVQGLRVVDAGKLGELEAPVLLDLQRSGALALAYAQLFSLSNLEGSRLASGEPSAANAFSSGNISFEGVDWSKF